MARVTGNRGRSDYEAARGFPDISRTSAADPRGGSTLRSRSDYGRPLGLSIATAPQPRSVIGVSCFIVAPPYRKHGVASALLDRVIADASTRGASWIEAYPHNEPQQSDAGHFRGPRSIYEERGFQPIEVREHYTVMRRRVG